MTNDLHTHQANVFDDAHEDMTYVIWKLQKVRDDLNLAGAPLGLIRRYETILDQLFDLQGDTNLADFTNPFAD